MDRDELIDYIEESWYDEKEKAVRLEFYDSMTKDFIANQEG